MFQLEPKGSDIRETLNLTPFYLKRLKGAHPGVPTGLTCLTYLPTPWALPDVRQVTYVRAILPTGPTCLTYPPSARALPDVGQVTYGRAFLPTGSNLRPPRAPAALRERKPTAKEAPRTLGASAALNPKGVDFGRTGWEFAHHVHERRHTPWGGREISTGTP